MCKRSIFIFFGLIIGLMFVFGDAFLLCAQETKSDEFTLEEITVTAQKRAENVQKVAISMDVISGEELAATGKTNVDDILRDLSTVMIIKAEDGMRVTVRGIADDGSTFHNMHVSTPTVAVNIDGSFNSSSNAGQNLFDVERVEVLAGPQSTLYGSNSPGGVVNVVTAAPKMQKYSASATVEYGKYKLLKAQTALNIPVYSDKIAMRLAAERSKRGSWVDNGSNPQKSTNVRLRTLWQPSDKLSSTLTLSWSKSGRGGQLGSNVKVFDYQDGYYQDGTKVTNPWTASDTAGQPAGPPPGSFTAVGSNLSAAQPPPPPGGGGPQIPGPMGNNAVTKGISGEIKWDAGIGSVSFVPSYSRSATKNTTYNFVVSTDAEGNATDYTNVYSENHTFQKSAELRLTSPEDFLFKWIVGATYYNSEMANFQQDLLGKLSNAYQSNKSTQKNKALYANITYPFTEKFRGTMGYRRSWDKTQNVEVPPMVGNGITGQKNAGRPDYKLGVEYDLSQNHMLFANYSTSYRINMMVDNSRPPETMKAYTLGSKNRFFDNKLQTNASVFYYDYRNKGLPFMDSGRFNGAVNETSYPYTDKNGVHHIGTDFNNNGTETDTNLRGVTDPYISSQYGGFRSLGIDLSNDWVISDKDRLNLSVSYLNAKYTDSTIHFYWDWIWPDKSYDGTRNSNSPPWSGSASYEHNFTLGSFGTLTPQVDMQWKGGYTLEFGGQHDPWDYQEAYKTWNGSLTFNHSSGKWSVNGYIKNIRNYAVKTFWMNVAGNYTLGLNDPRSYGGVLSVRF